MIAPREAEMSVVRAIVPLYGRTVMRSSWLNGIVPLASLLKNAGEEAFIIQGNNDDCNNDYDQFELATVQNKGEAISREPIDCEVLPSLIEINHYGLNISI